MAFTSLGYGMFYTISQYFHPNYYIPALSHPLSHAPLLYDSKKTPTLSNLAHFHPAANPLDWRVDAIPAFSSNGTATIPSGRTGTGTRSRHLDRCAVLDLSELMGHLVCVIDPDSPHAWILRIVLVSDYIWLGMHWARSNYSGELSVLSSLSWQVTKPC